MHPCRKPLKNRTKKIWAALNDISYTIGSFNWKQCRFCRNFVHLNKYWFFFLANPISFRMKNPLWFIIWLILLIISLFIAGFCAGWYIFIHPLTVCIPALSVSKIEWDIDVWLSNIVWDVQSGHLFVYRRIITWTFSLTIFRVWVTFCCRELSCHITVHNQWSNVVH